MKLSTTNHYEIKFCLYGLKEIFPFLLWDFLHTSYIINNHERGFFHMSVENSDLKKLLSPKNPL